MIPLRDVIPSRATPYLTITIIAINAVAWLYELTLPRDTLTLFLQQFGVVPAFFSAPTLVTSMFLHGSWSHVIGNMWYLWIFGDNVEDRFGHAGYLLFYLGAGIVAALVQYATNPVSGLPTVGASGAIAGVLGAYAMAFPRARVITLVPLFVFIQIIPLPALLVLGLWFVIQFFSGTLALASTMSGGIAFWAHIGGFAFGALAMLVLGRDRRDSYARVEY